jgi:hypothetical protein
LEYPKALGFLWAQGLCPVAKALGKSQIKLAMFWLNGVKYILIGLRYSVGRSYKILKWAIGFSLPEHASLQSSY